MIVNGATDAASSVVTARDSGQPLEPVSSVLSSENESKHQALVVWQVTGAQQPVTSVGRMPWNDIHQELAVTHLVRSWRPCSVIGMADLFKMLDAGLSRQPVGQAATAIGRRYHLSAKARSQPKRCLAATVYGYRQTQQEVCHLLPVSPSNEAAAVVAIQI